jgi:hypothetical protein
MVAMALVAMGLLSLAGSACSSGKTDTGTGPDLAESSTGASSSEDRGDSSTTAVAEGTGEGDSSGPPPASSSSSSDDGMLTSTTDDGCPLGSEGCPCNAGVCDDDLECLDGTCQVVCTEDLYEPNDAEDAATDLGEIDDDDDHGGVLSASLHHVGDVDWFRYYGNDDFPSVVDPTRELVASGGLRLCKFLECDAGLVETEFECPVGTQYALSPMARPGCCASDGFALANLDCAGVTEDNTTVYIRVDQPEPACVTYSISYHY